MQYWVVKSNRDKYQTEEGVANLVSEDFTHWSVSAGCKTGDIAFIGQSGKTAAIFVEVELTSDPEQGVSTDDPYWLDKEEAKKTRWYSGVKVIRECLGSPISESQLRDRDLIVRITGSSTSTGGTAAGALDRVADFLRRQSRSLKLTDVEARALEALFLRP